MKRTLFGLAVAALTVLALAGPAGAAAGKAQVFRFQGAFAEAMWTSSTDTSSTTTNVTVSTSRQGSELFVAQFTSNFEGGNFTGFTRTEVGVPGEPQPGVTSGFSFAIDQVKLTSATLSGAGLPATTCTYDADGNQIGCSPATVGVDATWEGQGPITRGVENSVMNGGGIVFVFHTNGTSRDATATATFTGLPAPLGELQFADLGTTNSGQVKVCIACQPTP